MSERRIDSGLLEQLRQFRAATPQAVATDLAMFNKIVEIDHEMAMVRARRAVDLIVRNLAQESGIVAGSRPMEVIIHDLSKAQKIPSVIERHCRIVKDFGNLAAHGGEASEEYDSGASLSSAEADLCAESTSAILRWYISRVAPTLPDDMPYRIFSGSQVSRAMIDQALAIDSAVYPEHLRGIRDVCYQWLARNPDIYIIIMDPAADIVVGYINAMPLEKDFYNELESGRRIDVDFPPQALRTYDLPDLYELYFCSIAVNPSYHTTSAFRTLYDAFIDKLLALARREIFMTEILADAVTEEGRKLCLYAGMKSIKQTAHSSELFKVSLLPPALRATSLKAKNLLVFYQDRYEGFRNLLPQGGTP